MSDSNWARIQELYHSALNCHPDERAAFLLQACPNEENVRIEVESLLAHEGRADMLLEVPLSNVFSPAGHIGGPPNPVLAAGSNFGTYCIVECLGIGGMGEVYRAKDTKLGREVALKVLPAAYAHDPAWFSRFQREARSLALLNHPGIAAIYGLEEHGGISVLVMELVKGPTLSGLIARGPVPLTESLTIARQIAAALAYAHEKGLVHRDLKPPNIKITPEGLVKLLDFGLAKPSQPSSGADASPTQAGFVLGTPAYMAPEQARGQAVDHRADIWAFGAVLWEMVTGRQLFVAATVADTLAAVLTREPDFRQVPLRVRHLLRLCVTRDARHRLSHMSSALVLLDEEASGAPPRRRVGWQWPAAAFVCLLVAVLAFYHYPQTLPTAPIVRFRVPLPSNTAFSGHLSVSPDGQQLAFAARGLDGHVSIWIHSLDQSGSRSLTGTENGGFFFWSPDSRYLAFWADNKLKKVDTLGGPPEAICSTKNEALGGAWSSNGVILFGSAAGHLWRVPASGGIPVPITALASGIESNHAFPVFLPDRRHIFYHARSSRGEGNAVYVTEFRPERQLERGKNVARSQTGAQYVSGANGNGHLLLLRGTTLLAQQFDESALQTVGDPFPLAEHVGSRLTYPFLGVSKNVLAWWSDASETNLVWFDRQGKRIGVPLLGEFGDLALAADGQRVAVSQSHGEGLDQNLSVIDLGHSASIRLTSGTGDADSAVWSPDGRRVVYRDSGSSELRVAQASGAGGGEMLPLPSGRKTPTDWSRDGIYLLYTTSSPSMQGDIWVFPIGTPAVHPKPFPYLQSAHRKSQGRFSPDGHFVAYSSNETGRTEIYIQEFPAAGGKWPISTTGGSQPRWRADGKELFFLDENRSLMSVTVATSPGLRLSPPQRLFDSHQSSRISRGLFGYDVTQDGRRFLVNVGTGNDSAGAIDVMLNWQSLKR